MTRDQTDLEEDAIKCRLLWMVVERPELYKWIGNGPGQVSIERLIELMLQDDSEEHSLGRLGR